MSANGTDHGSPATGSNEEATERQTFVGEASERNHVGQTTEVGVSPTASPVNHRPLTPRVRPVDQLTSRKPRPNSDSWLRELLHSFGVVPESLDSRAFLGVFFDEVHIIYPFLHPPSIWQTLEIVWGRALRISMEDLEKQGESKCTVALLFVCLAIGRCTASSRKPDSDGAQSAGWSLYSVAVELMRPYLDVTSDSTTSLYSLEVLATMVMSLFSSLRSETDSDILAGSLPG